MKESTQTLLFIAAALASVFVASSSRPTDATYEVSDLIGTPLFAAFAPEEAASMRIVRFDEATATLREFEVAEQDGVWSLPSKGGYPADAESQMAEASTGVIDLEILAIATQSAADHAEYGVVEPSSNLDVGATGVGTRVTLESTDGKSLVDVVVGKEVKDAEDQHFVRRTNQDVVFVVGIDPESFSTKFEDWIESDLLDLEAWDIARVRVKDYSAELVMQGFRPAIAFDPRADLAVAYDEGDSKWKPLDLKEYDRDSEQYVDFELTDLEELSEDVLTDLKNAVGDLEIVDVERKPSGLSGDLKAGDDFFQDRGSVQSLMDRGFAPTKGESGETEVLSSEGEVLVTLKDGVEYVLRFGKLQLASANEDQDDTEAAEGDDEESSGVNRYLFVMARYNEDLIEQPELEELPAEDASDDTSDADSEEGASEDEAEEASTESDDRDAIVKRNQRLQDEYNAKVEQAKQRVEQLNDRFGDWYYVISDEVYKKVAIGRDDLIVAKEPEEDEEDVMAGDTADQPPLGGGIPGLPNIPGVSRAPSADASASSEEAIAEASDEAPTTDAPTTDAAEPSQVETPPTDTTEASGDADPSAVEAAADAAGVETPAAE